MGQTLLRWTWGIAAAIMAALPGHAGADDGAAERAKREFFEAKVRPLLADHCFACHGDQKQKAGLRLDSADAIHHGGDAGPVIEPGDPENSPLIEAIRYDGPIKMPPKEKLSEDEIKALTDWVQMGAPWPGADAKADPIVQAEPGVISEEDRAFWAFQPIRDPSPPTVKDAAWPRSSIDPFILARLESTGLAPAPRADKRTLIRRATFDLIGLPPTPEEIDAFLADESPDAFERVVERLLASPHYGERWGRHWLDIARYGEDQAHSFKPRLYPNGFRYRDWVANAFNADMPYDRFIVEQIAADLLDEPGRRERLPALGFFACGPVYYGDRKMFDQYDDRIDTLSRGFLGLTVACARCHDHKFDPISQADYYALAGVIASTEYEETPIAPPEEVAAYKEAQAAIAAKEDAIEAFLQVETDHLAAERASEIVHSLLAAWDWKNRQAGADKPSVETFADEHGLSKRSLNRWVEYLDRIADSERPRHAALRKLLQDHKPSAALADDAAIREEVEKVTQAFQKDVLKLLALRSPTTVEVAAKAGGGSGDEPAPTESKGLDKSDRALLDDLFGEKGPLAIREKQVEKALSEESRSKLAALRSERDQLKESAPPMYAEAHALKNGKPTDLPILQRGNPDNPGPIVPRHFLTILGGETFTEGSGRLELARAIASPDNPLTARVMVNRIWAHHFGSGLVGTSSNFGKLGERPSHPELLDHLASRFIASGWSIKAIHRMILLSATYQESSRFDARAFEKDPENRLHWRQNRRRLEVEAWRDAMLAVSGRLDPTIGGPSQEIDDPANRRRSYYAAISRHDLSPLLRLFDFPDPNITSAERTHTTVPLQLLFVLNDEFMVQAARSLTARLADSVGDANVDRIQAAYVLLFGRLPTNEETRLGLAYLDAPDGPDAGDLSRWERYAQVLLGSNEFVYID